MASRPTSIRTRRVWRTEADFEACTREIGADSTRRGVRLARSRMIQDERGRTHIHNKEQLSDSLWARKEFVLADGDLADGRLYFYGTAQHVALNGRRLKPVRKLPSTGWSVVRVPGRFLRKGRNEFVFSDGGELLVEDSVHPDRSARSLDGGATWDYGALGPQGMNDGEYLVRLRLDQYPPRATLTSQIIDFAELAAGNGVRPCVADVRVRLRAEMDRPPGTSLQLEARTAGQHGAWGPWQALSNVVRGKGLPRYFQWRASLSSTSGRATPTLRAVALDADVTMAARSRGNDVRVTHATPVNDLASSYRFAYQEPTERLARLVRQYKLKQVVAGRQTELEKLVALRNWCRHTAPKGWDMGRTQWCPPWDALVILETNRDPRALCMCTHYSTLFVQTAAALGYVARHVILDHHCVAEVWCNDLRKWVLMDTGNSHNPMRNCHFEHAGVPLNALEIRGLWQAKRVAEIRVVHPGRRSISGDRVKPKTQAAFENFRRFGIPLRNNHLDTPFPGELTQGSGEYFCDAYLWWEDAAAPTASPEYGLTSNRPADFYWPVNETVIELSETRQPGVLAVALRTVTPNLARLMVSLNGGRWQEKAAEFLWKLKPGRNAIETRSINSFGVAGPIADADLEWRG